MLIFEANLKSKNRLTDSSSGAEFRKFERVKLIFFTKMDPKNSRKENLLESVPATYDSAHFGQKIF